MKEKKRKYILISQYIMNNIILILNCELEVISIWVGHEIFTIDLLFKNIYLCVNEFESIYICMFENLFILSNPYNLLRVLKNVISYLTEYALAQ